MLWINTSYSRKARTGWSVIGLPFILGVLLVACQSSPTPPSVVFIGHPEHVAKATAFLSVKGLATKQNVKLSPTDVVLYIVSALDGPMPQTRGQLENIQGQAHGNAAIFFVNTSGVDPELLELILLEMRELLESYYGQPKVASLPVLYDDDANVFLALRDLLTPR
jgi:hypothetical protein